jgi:hypothetical protein
MMPNWRSDRRYFAGIIRKLIALLGAAQLLIFMGCNGSSGRPGLITVPPVKNACSRPGPGSVVQNPPSLTSANGLLAVYFSYQSTTDSEGRTLYCFMTPQGLENPTLNVSPGDTVTINITNNTASTSSVLEIDPPRCGSSTQLTSSSLDMHFHGTTIKPKCRQDEIIHTLINSKKTSYINCIFPITSRPGFIGTTLI